MGGNVERHIGDDDRDGAAIEALQPGGNGMTHAARDVLAERDEARAQVSASWIAGHAVGTGKGGCGLPCGYDCNGACFAPNFTPDDLIDLIGEFGREVYHLLDDCETSGPVGEEIHTITEDGLRKVSAILDRIEALPFEEPGVMLGTGAMLQAAIMQTFAHPPRTGGRRQMKVLIVGGQNRGQVVDVEATPSNMLELVQVRDPVRGEAFWFKVEADVKDKHSYVIGELCRAYEFVTRGETRRQHVGENGKL